MATPLAAKFAELVNTAPVIQDPEDIHLETKAQIEDKYEGDDSDLYFGSSQLRQRNSRTLDDVDPRYMGKKVTRELLEQESESENSELEDSEDELSSDVENNIEGYKAELALRSVPRGDFDNEMDYNLDFKDKELEEIQEKPSSDDASEDDEVADNSNQEDDSNADSDDEDIVTLVPEKDMVQKFSQIDINLELRKGKAVQAQLALWDKLLECRIKAQKMLSIANRLPQHETWSTFYQWGGEHYQEVLKDDKKSLKKLLEKLLNIQEMLHQMGPKTNQVAHKNIINSDEEIPSDLEDEESNTRKLDQGSTKMDTPRKRKFTDVELPGILEKRHKDFVLHRNTTIQKWSDKTRLASGKVGQKSFAAFEQSALKQIEQILSDRDRLRKRTQLKRSTYRVLGQAEPKEAVSLKENVESKQDPSKNEHLKDYDPEIFDDDDFYHQLLRELIERKTADVNDPISISRQWLEIQKLRNKIKRKVDTKASKGRKIRFDVHAKLMNFMAPIEIQEVTDEAKNELFSSLFGKRSFQSQSS